MDYIAVYSRLGLINLQYNENDGQRMFRRSMPTMTAQKTTDRILAGAKEESTTTINSPDYLRLVE